MPAHYPFHTGFPCPNCGKQRESVRAACAACRYPQHDRKHTASPLAKLARRPFQFHLWWQMAGVTAAAIFLAIYTQQENSQLMQGLAGAGMIIGVFDPVMPFFVELARGLWREYAEAQSKEDDENQTPV
jgi:hypothetical protein